MKYRIYIKSIRVGQKLHTHIEDEEQSESV